MNDMTKQDKKPLSKDTFKIMAEKMLTTFFATTLSIILTFGTTHFVDKKKKRAAGRQTAMMIIHDIDNSVDMFRNSAKEEGENLQRTLYALNHIDSLESMPEDSVIAILNYIVHDEGITFAYDDSKERTFLSSQENWKNIDSPLFIDLVEEFFYTRRITIERLNSSASNWRGPVDVEEYNERLMAAWQSNAEIDYTRFLREKLKEPRVDFFIKNSPQRQKYLNEVADEWKHTSDQCKFLMGITDQELKEFIKKRERTGRQLSKRELIGRWITIDTDEQFQGIEFLKDKTFRLTAIHYYPSTLYTGKLKLTHVFTGTWELRGDSLYRTYNPGYEYSLDHSQINYTAEMKDTIERYLKRVETNIAQQAKEAKQKPTIKSTRFVCIDASGTKVEMSSQNEEGNELEESAYMIKEEK